ncbi:hypothetical protein AB0L13_43630, partial [Saccharopolyspora shandongensis]|uniref:hypothetical protein n=1 Tax=Saccharopolyspora shandongensis TaxID=418495 RepID=UPI0034263D46
YTEPMWRCGARRTAVTTLATSSAAMGEVRPVHAHAEEHPVDAVGGCGDVHGVGEVAGDDIRAEVAQRFGSGVVVVDHGANRLPLYASPATGGRL